jgi:hypothetical protein
MAQKKKLKTKLKTKLNRKAIKKTNNVRLLETAGTALFGGHCHVGGVHPQTPTASLHDTVAFSMI